MSLERIQQTLNELNQFGYSEKGINRLAYTKEEREAFNHIIKLCKREGLKVKVDPCGNLIARREGKNPDLPAVACGSHIDTVFNGGRFDGLLGVVSGLEVIRRLNERNVKTEHPIELIVFACEESSRFGVGTIGSKAMTGYLTEDFIKLKDKNDISIEKAFTENNLDINMFEKCIRERNELKVFLEMHIEQGPVLEKNKTEIGIVTDIAAPTRFSVSIQGEASHSGTTSMRLRKDALAGASEIVLALENLAIQESANETVATIGVLKVGPGAINTIPNLVEMKVDIRSASNSSKDYVANGLIETIKKVADKRQLTINHQLLFKEDTIHLDDTVIKQLEHSCKKLNLTYKTMMSGAGHDARNMAKRYPTGLIFVPSKNGLSHHPDEYTSLEAISVGVDLLEEQIIFQANSKREKA